MTTGIFLLLGSNLNDREANLQQATAGIEQTVGPIVQRSSVYRTAAWGKHDQPDFYNQVIQLDTPLDPQTLLTSILAVEQRLGRTRTEVWGSRIIDIDILLYHDRVIRSEVLNIPHPQLEFRRFALTPLAELAADVIHPVLQKKISELLEECPDQLAVQKI